MKNFPVNFAFLLPLIAFALLFLFVPVASTLLTGFFQEVEFLDKTFIGLENFKQLLRDQSFWQSSRFTLLFILVSVPLELALGISFALLLNEPLPCKWLLRAAVLIPWALPGAVSAKVWQLLYNYQYGLLNFLLLKFGIAEAPIHWLGDSTSAFGCLVLADVWKTTPFVAIIVLAGLQTIPADLYDQAKIDRAHFIDRFIYITLPLLKPTLLVALLFRSIDALRIFDLIYVLTSGGPGGSTTSLSLYSYRYFLLSDFGYGSAVSTVLFLIALLLSIIFMKAANFKETFS